MGQFGQMPEADPDGSVGGASGSAGMSLVFRAGQLLCALQLDEVIETMRPLAVRALAGTPAFIRGISIMRGVPAPVIDAAQLLGGRDSPATRFIAVRTERGPIALATGEVLGIRPTHGTTPRGTPLSGVAPAHLVARVGRVDTEPLFHLQSMRLLPDEVWAAAAPAEPS